jgi:hypothetical protein
LTSTPTTVLLALFYTITPSILLLDTATTLLSTTIPFALLRPIAPSHHPHDKSTRHSARNRPILTDRITTLATSFWASLLFMLLLQLSFYTFLPTFLITHFAHIRTLEPAHSGPYLMPILVLLTLPAGLACRYFLFAPSTSAPVREVVELDTVRGGFGEHVRWNLWGWYTGRQKELLGRAALAAGLVGAETVVKCAGELHGVEVVGALGYAGVWMVGVGVVSGAFWWMGGPSE